MFNLTQVGMYLSADNTVTRIIKNATSSVQSIFASGAILLGLLIIGWCVYEIAKYFFSERSQIKWAKVVWGLIIGGTLMTSGITFFLNFGASAKDVLDDLSAQVLPFIDSLF